jgi:hypothetical protein
MGAVVEVATEGTRHSASPARSTLRFVRTAGFRLDFADTTLITVFHREVMPAANFQVRP